MGERSLSITIPFFFFEIGYANSFSEKSCFKGKILKFKEVRSCDCQQTYFILNTRSEFESWGLENFTPGTMATYIWHLETLQESTKWARKLKIRKHTSNFQKGTVLSLGVVGKIDTNCRKDLEAIKPCSWEHSIGGVAVNIQEGICKMSGTQWPLSTVVVAITLIIITIILGCTF